jgi:hypothetical protein
MLAVVKNPAWDKMKNILCITNYNSMSRIGSALEANYNICFFCQKIYNFAFAFVTPLGTYKNGIHFYFFLTFI